MEEKFNEATKNRPEGDRPVDGPELLLDIDTFYKQLRSEKAWKKNDHNAITLFKTNGMTIVLVALHANCEVNPDSVEHVVSLQVLKGKIKFKGNAEEITVKENQVIAVNRGIKHSIKSAKKSLVLLTIAN